MDTTYIYEQIKGVLWEDGITAESSSEEPPKRRSSLRKLFFFSRLLVTIAIVGLLIASAIVVLVGFAELIRIMSFIASHGLFAEEAGTFLSITVTEMIDLFLIGLVLIIFAPGLYQLFIDPNVTLPYWLQTPSLDPLKQRLLVVILVVLAVIFLGTAPAMTDGIAVAGPGIAISLVMIAIGYVLSVVTRARIELMRLEKQGAGKEEEE